jgi:group II intron reverse transcriptase/maturase
VVAGEVGEAHSTDDGEDNITSLLGKGLYFREAFMEQQPLNIDKNLPVKPLVTADEKVRVFQRKLYLRAKQDKSFKAYSLYDKICQPHVLHEAWQRVKTGKQEYDGGGVDKLTFGMIEKKGVSLFLSDIRKDLLNKTYRPQAIRRVMIDKAGSKEKRPLGIPTIRDRVVQMAVKMMIEPLFEADFIETSYGFRPKKSAHDAIRKIKENLFAGYQFVYDADLSKYFDTIPHDKLMKVVSGRLADKSILTLLRMWLRSPVKLPSGQMEKSRVGTPQGGVISPLLANIYMNVFDQLIDDPEGVYAKEDIRIVRYADDFILMKTKHYPPKILRRMNNTLTRMGLKINEKKTKLLHISKSSFSFLGFEFRMVQSKFKWNTKRYTNIRPSIKSRSKLYANISDCLGKRRHWKIEPMVYKLNEILIGWLNYYSISGVTHIWDTVSQIKWHLDYKLYKWLKSKGRKAHKALRQRPFESLVKYKHLLDIEKYASMKFHAKATGRTLSVSRMSE